MGQQGIPERLQNHIKALQRDHEVYTENFGKFLDMLMLPEDEKDYEALLRLAGMMRADLSSTATFYSVVLGVLREMKEAQGKRRT